MHTYVKVVPNDRGVPAGKLADVELHFAGVKLDGLTLIGAAGRVGDRLSLPMTEYVRGLIENARGPESARRRYYGFLLNDDRSQREPTAADSRRLNLTSSPSGCIGRYRDLSLHVRLER